MIIWRTNDNFANNLLESGLLYGFHVFGGVHVIHGLTFETLLDIQTDILETIS